MRRYSNTDACDHGQKPSQSLALSLSPSSPHKHTRAFECGAGCCSGTNRSSGHPLSVNPEAETLQSVVMVWHFCAIFNFEFLLQPMPAAGHATCRKNRLDYEITPITQCKHCSNTTCYVLIYIHKIHTHTQSEAMATEYVEEQTQQYQHHLHDTPASNSIALNVSGFEHYAHSHHMVLI